MLAMALASLEPNLVTHSSLVTTDIGVTLFIFLGRLSSLGVSPFTRWWLLVCHRRFHGLALLSKFSALLLIPMIASIVALPRFVGGEPFLCPLRKNRNDKSQTSQAGNGAFSHTFFCLTHDSSSLLFSRISTLVMRLLGVSGLGASGSAGLFLGRIFLSRLVELFRGGFFHQDAARQPDANHCLTCFLPCRHPLGRREAIVSFSAGGCCFRCYEPRRK